MTKDTTLVQKLDGNLDEELADLMVQHVMQCMHNVTDEVSATQNNEVLADITYEYITQVKALFIKYGVPDAPQTREAWLRSKSDHWGDLDEPAQSTRA